MDTSLEITATKTTPHVLMDLENEQMLIEGRSLPEKGVLFYEKIINWVNEHAAASALNAELEVKLQYCNTSTYKGLMLLFRAIEKQNKKGASISVGWYFDEEDEDWLEDGKTFDEMVGVPFNFISIPA